MRHLRGHGGGLSFSKIAGERVRLNTNVGYKTPGFEINDLGYVGRADRIATTTRWLAEGRGPVTVGEDGMPETPAFRSTMLPVGTSRNV